MSEPAREPQPSPDQCPKCSHNWHGFRCKFEVYRPLLTHRCLCRSSFSEERPASQEGAA